MKENFENLIELNAKIMLGKPVIKGTRITVELILEKLGAGEGFDQILEAHPRLTRNHIYAALQYALKTIKNEEIHISIAA